MNFDLLRDVRNVIAANPSGFDMGNWVVKRLCGTTCCIAGYAYFLSVGHEPCDTELPQVTQGASRFLGINKAQEERLYYSGNWPQSFIVYEEQPSPEAAIELLDRLIDGRIVLTEEGEWLGDLEYSPETPAETQEEQTEALSVAHEEALV